MQNRALILKSRTLNAPIQIKDKTNFDKVHNSRKEERYVKENIYILLIKLEKD